jgi:hypothetical protein
VSTEVFKLDRVVKVRKEDQAPWLKGEVMRHCVVCESVVGRMDRVCSSCSAPLRKECPTCHYLVEMDATFCISCRHAFPLPAPQKSTVKMWHQRG